MNRITHNSRLRVAAQAAFGVAICLACSAAPRLGNAEEAMLRLATGDGLPVQILAGSTPQRVRCTTTLTVAPIEFPLDAIASLTFRERAEPTVPTGTFRFELWGDDVLYGHLKTLTEESCVVEVPALGLIELPRRAVRRISRSGRWQNLILAPPEQHGWKLLTQNRPWQAIGGQLVANQPRAAIHRNVELPEQAVIEVAVSWNEDPDFVLALGVDDDSMADGPLRLEVWDGAVLLVCETGDKADLVWLQEAPSRPSRLRLTLFLDSQAGTLIALDAAGKQLGELAVPLPGKTAMRGVRLVNRSGTTRLERLRIAAWDGTLPQPSDEAEAWVRLADHTIQPGQAFLSDGPSEVLVRNGEASDTYELDQISEIVLATESNVPAEQGALVEVQLRPSMQLTGQLVAIDEEALMLQVPGVSGSVRLPLASIGGLTVVAPADPGEWPVGRRPAQLEVGSTVLAGELVDGSRGDSAPLVWRARGALRPTPLRPDLSGRIVFADPRGVGSADRRRQPPAINATQPPAAGNLQPPRLLLGHAIYLRSGDAAPADIRSIDADGVHLETSVSTATTIPHAVVKAAVLWDAATLPTLDELRRRRLLTPPRSAVDDPPTHLISSKDGDYLRCQLLAMDERFIMVASRGATKRLERRHVAWIVWLDEAEAPGPPAAGGQAGAVRVQAIRRDGVRLTFAAERVEGGAIRGTSRTLGACRVEISEIDMLLLGGAIEEAAGASPFRGWELQPEAAP